MPRSLRKIVAATLVGMSLIVVTARSSEGQTTGRLQVRARVIAVGPQQEALTQARMAAVQLLRSEEVLEARTAAGLISLTVSRVDAGAGRNSPGAFAVASLVYIAN